MSGSDLPKDDCYLVSMRFETGVIGKLFVSSGCNGAPFDSFLEVYGAEGTLTKGRLLSRDRQPMILEDTFGLESAGGHGWPGAVNDFLKLVTGEIDNPIPSLRGARAVAVSEAAFTSMREGRPQPVEWFE